MPLHVVNSGQQLVRFRSGTLTNLFNFARSFLRAETTVVVVDVRVSAKAVRASELVFARLEASTCLRDMVHLFMILNTNTGK